MKKVGLLTFHFPINYGAFLQTFGLQEYVKENGHSVDIINYYTDAHIKKFDFYNKPKTIKEFLFFVVKSLFFFSYRSKKKKFQAFSEKNFKLTKRSKKIDTVSFDYDIVLTGSDQVFNINHGDRLIYFQPFNKKVDQIKAAYAPSFGINDLDDSIKRKIEKYVLDFDFLSCREKGGAEFLSKLTNENVEHVLDPVFLLSKEKWSEVASNRIINENYIFIYDLNGKKPLIDKAKAIANGRKIVIISNDPIASLRSAYKPCDIFVKSAGIEDFISLVMHADVVITDSFHGTAMSIIFRKEFYTYIALKSASMRIYSLLKIFSLESRVFDNLSLSNNVDIFPPFDLNNYDFLVNKSKSYLKKFL